MSFRSSIILTASLASIVLARTDLTGCTSTDVSSPAGASLAWYVPGTGELCQFLDCGGGMAPPKTTVPGCPLYSGTATYSPSYLAGYGAMTASAASSASTSAVAISSSATQSSLVGSSSASSTSDSSSELSYTTTTTQTGAWSETSETVSVANSAVLSSTLSTSMTTITSAPAVLGTGAVSSGPTSASNGTLASVTPHPTSSSSPISTGAAVGSVKFWMGGAGLLGVGAVVAAL